MVAWNIRVTGGANAPLYERGHLAVHDVSLHPDGVDVTGTRWGHDKPIGRIGESVVVCRQDYSAKPPLPDYYLDCGLMCPGNYCGEYAEPGVDEEGDSVEPMADGSVYLYGRWNTQSGMYVVGKEGTGFVFNNRSYVKYAGHGLCSPLGR